MRPRIFRRPFSPIRFIGQIVASGAAATAASTAALALVARVEGVGAAQPLNATSHWLYGDEAAGFRSADVDHTSIGFATHTAATVFWASAFETAMALRPTRDPLTVVGRAAAIGTLAAIVDYTVTPRRFTPGWELVLSKQAMAVVYAAMAAGFAVSAISR